VKTAMRYPAAEKLEIIRLVGAVVQPLQVPDKIRSRRQAGASRSTRTEVPG
jgi:hypothetical protein